MYLTFLLAVLIAANVLFVHHYVIFIDHLKTSLICTFYVILSRESFYLIDLFLLGSDDERNEINAFLTWNFAMNYSVLTSYMWRID